ncbi:MAG TPA: cell envelope integrity protein TolA, partial [Gammaproteobacteria bacterium]|nr:cell envelope integrity protein TolA [Gammaproteobacteria bacterium]
EAETLRLAELEKQKQAEVAKQKEAELAKQKEAQAQAEADRLKEQAKQQQLLAEQQAITAQQQADLQQAILTEVERYTLMVKQKVMQNWLIQRGYEGLTTQLHVRVAPGGAVLDVQVIKKSGNEALDRSAVSAVYRASPLPVPSDPAVFESFRELRLILRPEDVLG